MDDRFEHFTYLILKTSKLIQRLKTLEVEEYGLKAVHVMCIYCLNKSKNGLTSKELVEYTQEDKAAISRALNLLKKKNIVNYDSSKYSEPILLTNYGKEIAKEIDRKSIIALHKSSESISEQERCKLYVTLEKILNNIENYYQEKLDERGNK